MKRFFTWAALVVTIASFGMPTAQVLAVDESFYSTNDILFFNPDSCPISRSTAASSSALQGGDNLEKILRYYVGKGLTLAQASGIAGNFSRESGFNPAIVQGGVSATDGYTPVDGTGFGIAQWTDAGRQAGLVALSQTSKRSIIDLSLQLDYTWQELSTNRSAALTSLKAATTADNAAFVFHRDYEGSADTEEQVLKNRGGDALNIYQQFKVIISDGTSDTASENRVCEGGGSSDFVNNFTVYNQNDPLWNNLPYGEATIGESGCGPSAMAMIITALTGEKVTPLDTSNYGAANGTLYQNGVGGSLHNIDTVIGGHWGLKSSNPGKDVAAINQGLRDGGLVILAGSGAAPFTSGGHFIMVRAVTDSGMWLIGDSNGSKGQENSKKEWDPVFILSMVGSYARILTK